MKNTSLMSSVFLAAGLFYLPAYANDIHYYSDREQEAVVSAQSDTLLVFPSPPLTSACQPRGVVEFSSLEDDGALNKTPTLNDATGVPKTKSLQESSSMKTSPLGRLLKLVVQDGAASGTSCAFTLADGDSFSVRFSLSQDLVRPQLEFKKQLSREKTIVESSRALSGLNLFRSFLIGTTPSVLVDVTPKQPSSGKPAAVNFLHYSSEQASYTLTYLGTDKLQYKIWRFEGETHKPAKDILLKGKDLGDILYSSVVNSKIPLTADATFTLLVLSKADLDPKDMEGMLP